MWKPLPTSHKINGQKRVHFDDLTWSGSKNNYTSFMNVLLSKVPLTSFLLYTKYNPSTMNYKLQNAVHLIEPVLKNSNLAAEVLVWSWASQISIACTTLRWNLIIKDWVRLMSINILPFYTVNICLTIDKYFQQTSIAVLVSASSLRDEGLTTVPRRITTIKQISFS